MAKVNPTLRATPAQRAALAAAVGCDPDSKAERHRRWACRIVSDLPSHRDDAQNVLDLAGELLRGWASGVGRAAR